MKNRLKSYTQYEIIKVIASGGMGTVAKAKLKGVEGQEVYYTETDEHIPGKPYPPEPETETETEPEPEGESA